MTTKEQVLTELNKSKENPVSGEKLAELCGVSRAAVWKAVKTLREQGYEITGTTNGGYILNSASDSFSLESVKSYINKNYPEFSDCSVEVFKEIDSTNSYAKRLLAQNGALRNADETLTEAGKKLHKTILIAESQTQGHGRLGRTFVSPAKTGIYITVIYAPEGGISKPAFYTAGTGVAVCRAIKKLYHKNPSIKWINDIFINGKKICGILTEGTANFETGRIEAAVIGYGINIQDNPEIFGKEVSKVAGSILDSSESVQVSRSDLAAESACQILKIFEEPQKKIMEEYKSLCFLTGLKIEIFPVIGETKNSWFAEVIDIDEEAGLVVKAEDGTVKTLSSGEVSIRSESFAK